METNVSIVLAMCIYMYIYICVCVCVFVYMAGWANDLLKSEECSIHKGPMNLILQVGLMIAYSMKPPVAKMC